jgi:hypothetical protein
MPINLERAASRAIIAATAGGMGEFLLDHQQHNCITISPHLLD